MVKESRNSYSSQEVVTDLFLRSWDDYRIPDPLKPMFR